MTGATDLPAAWGAEARGNGLRLRPRVEPGAPPLEASRVRVGRTLLDLSAARRPGRAVVKVARRFGPDLGITLAWDGPEPVVAVSVDDQPLGGTEVRFIARHEHEAQFLLGEAG